MRDTPTFPAPVPWPQRQRAFATPTDAVYLDAASKGARLRHVLDGAHAMLEAEAAPWWLPHADWMRRIEDARALAAQVLFDGDVEGLAMVPSAAHGLATAAANLPLRRGQAVLVLDGQFPSNLLAWQQRCAQAGAHVVGAAPRADETLTEAVLRTIDHTPQLAIATLPHCYWHDGRLLDLDDIADAVHARGAALVLDLSQSLGVLPLQLARWRPDFVVAVGYKWLLGTMGLTWLWASPRWRDEGVPLEQHWVARDAGADWVFPLDTPPPYLPGARRFDAGGIADPLRLLLTHGGLAQLQAWQPARIAAALGEVTAALDAALDARGLSAWKTPGHAPHIAGLRVPGERLEAVAGAFARRGVICSRRQGCLRLAPYLMVTAEQVEEVVEIAASA
ncbi:aminotransferase class V-fold PLP-dependent enzyme [Pseudoxanthomonas winnipegensis]|uniref:aminotransferase class V-fold PLP-dependent enzyme n=1 Tax=Pseudoxanthomonas winnipegensis TaxID=2480810 RepID=UPI00103A2CA9|nr:aminotransferase class V-fold PLP-dependent enzyme [Pseudoxanthomonas winnipegensis]TBV74749.1 aminotransferase class V-fold PLP-dependent enzyme [Pseudoxanthomonas winnipegensis]